MVEDHLEKTRQELILIGISVLSLVLLITAVVIFFAYRKKQGSEALLELKKKELEEINLKLKEEKRIAQKATQSKSDFLSTMTHELRTPLNAVIGISNMLEEESNEQKRKEALQTLKFASKNLLSLINDILDFNKLESGNVNLEEVSFNLTTLLQNIRMSFQLQASQKSIRFTVHRSGNVPEMVMGDPTRLTQVLSNLVSNAIKFTEQGFVRMYAELVHEKSGKARIRFIVKDTGIGIPPEKQDLIFNSFQQADQSTSRKFGGSGLGLAISKKIIELSGGQLKLESQEGLGATFMFELPFKLVNDESTDVLKEVTIEELEEMKSQLRYKRVLLVDDNEMNLFVARNILQSMEVDPIEASSGFEAIDIFEERTDFSMVLLDLQMPGIDGYETARTIRSINSKIPIIALTASSKEEVNMSSSGFRFNGFIRKPFEVDQLIQTMFKSSGLSFNRDQKKPSPQPRV
jgi:signal transduction histidine kinase/ActR/RegA family two-component response regulator